MSNYVFGTTLSYRDYLQAQSFERGLKSEISSATRSIIASNEELQRESISVLQSLSSSMSTGFENLSIQFDEISAGMNQLNATFQWGFSELLTQTSRINDSLKELIRLATTPAQTWAYEQFEIARDADRKGLFEESIEYLNRAIGGYGGQTGYKLEYRFHFLLGRIRLGGFRNYSDDIVNLEESERAFLFAARYAAQDAPNEAARAFLAAGWAAYSRGEMTEAQRHTQNAISFDPNLSEAHFQLAKVLVHVGQPDQALSPLQDAIELDRGYMIKASADGDFKPYERQLRSLCEELRRLAQDQVSACFATLAQGKNDLEQQRKSEFHLVEILNFEDFDRSTALAISAAGHNTYYGYLDALAFCEEAQTELHRVLEKTRTQHQKRLAEIAALDLRRAQQEEAVEAARFQKIKNNAEVSFGTSVFCLFCYIFSPVALVFAIWALSRYRSTNKKEGMGFAIAAITISGIESMVLLLFLIVMIISGLTQGPTP